MTRETKIGLLVGLAFIIVIGILLSDHLTSTTEPPQAALAQAGNSLRQGISVPGVQNPPVRIVPNPQDATPQQPVPTIRDLEPRPDPSTIITIGPSDPQRAQTEAQQEHGQPQTIVVGPAQPQRDPFAQHGPTPEQIAAMQQQQMQQAMQQGAASDPSQQPHQQPSQALSQNAPLASVAREVGEEMIGLENLPSAAQPQQPLASTAQPTSTGPKKYTAQEGDSVSRIAARQMGGNTKANREALIRANPSLQKNPDHVVIGQSYVIPAQVHVASTATDPNVNVASQQVASTTEKQTTAKPQAVASREPSYTYTVKPNDTLWGIAKEQLGDIRAIAAIKELNQNVLKGQNKDVVVVGTKLKLPAKPLASAD